MSMLYNNLVSHIAECKMAVRKSNNCDGGCITRELDKQEWKSEIFVVGQVMYWPTLYIYVMKQLWQQLSGLDGDALALMNSLLEPDKCISRN